MAIGFRRWRPRHLLLAWSGYWLALALATLGRPLLAAWRITRVPDSQGTMSAGVEHGVARLSLVADGATVWTGSAPLLSITLWLAGPPLLLWVAWLVGQRRSRVADAVEVSPRAAPSGIGGSAPPAALREPAEPLPGDAGTSRRTAQPVRRTPDRAG